MSITRYFSDINISIIYHYNLHNYKYAKPDTYNSIKYHTNPYKHYKPNYKAYETFPFSRHVTGDDTAREYTNIQISYLSLIKDHLNLNLPKQIPPLHKNFSDQLEYELLKNNKITHKKPKYLQTPRDRTYNESVTDAVSKNYDRYTTDTKKWVMQFNRNGRPNGLANLTGATRPTHIRKPIIIRNRVLTYMRSIYESKTAYFEYDAYDLIEKYMLTIMEKLIINTLYYVKQNHRKSSIKLTDVESAAKKLRVTRLIK